MWRKRWPWKKLRKHWRGSSQNLGFWAHWLSQVSWPTLFWSSHVHLNLCPLWEIMYCLPTYFPQQREKFSRPLWPPKCWTRYIEDNYQVLTFCSICKAGERRSPDPCPAWQGRSAKQHWGRWDLPKTSYWKPSVHYCQVWQDWMMIAVGVLIREGLFLLVAVLENERQEGLIKSSNVLHWHILVTVGAQMKEERGRKVDAALGRRFRGRQQLSWQIKRSFQFDTRPLFTKHNSPSFW